MRYSCSVALILALCLFVPAAFAREWRQHQASMGTKQSKMKALEGEIEELIHHKKGTENPDEITHITTTLAEKHAELAKVAREYREEQLHIRFKHPEQGDESERKYPRYQLKTLKEMASGHGLDAKLDKIKERLQHTFGMKKTESEEETAKGEKESSHAREPAQEKRPAEADERIHISK